MERFRNDAGPSGFSLFQATGNNLARARSLACSIVIGVGKSAPMETLTEILWPIVVAGGSAGGLGRFIDFLIGKAGQEQARDWLLKWWIRFDDVHWKNFGREMQSR